MGVLDCRDPALAVRQFTGILNMFFLWPWMIGRKGASIAAEEVIEDTIQMFLQHYRRPQPGKRDHDIGV